MRHEEISLQTKKALAEALKRAMKQKPFQKITVSELIQDCQINRKTFYYHFDDIYALLKWMLEQEAIEVVKQFDLLVDYEEAIHFVMDYIEQNDYLLNCDSIGHDELKRFFCADFLEIVHSLVGQAEAMYHKKLDENYKEFLCNFYVEAIAGILITWIKEKKVANRSVMIEYLSRTIRTSLIGILKEPASAET